MIDPIPISPGLGATNNDRLFFHNLDNLKPSLQPIKGESYFMTFQSVEV